MKATYGIYDESTELYYLNARYYDPATSRMLTMDTYRGEKTDPSSLHLYSYCANNPINFIDPSGHKKYEIKMQYKYKKDRVITKVNLKAEQKKGLVKLRKKPSVKSTRKANYYSRRGPWEYKTNNAINFFFKVNHYYNGIKFAVEVKYGRGSQGIAKKTRFHAELYRKPKKKNGKNVYYHKSVKEFNVDSGFWSMLVDIIS